MEVEGRNICFLITEKASLCGRLENSLMIMMANCFVLKAKIVL